MAAGGFTWLGNTADSFNVPEYSLTALCIGGMLILGGCYYRVILTNVSNVIIPEKGITFRNMIEYYGHFIYDQCKTVIGEKDGSRYFPFIATVFLFILISNLIGLVPGFFPPTEYLNTTLALGAFTFVYYNIEGCKEQGTLNYLKHFCGPLWYLSFLIFPIEVISSLIRPFSLALRLRFNIMGDHIVLSEFSNLVPLFLPIFFMILGILVSLVQAYVFTVLTMVYIKMAVEHHDHG